MNLSGQLKESGEFFRTFLTRVPDMAIILGSGMGAVADDMPHTIRIPYGNIPHFPPVSISGHSGAMLIAETGHKTLLILSGRPHYYESASLGQVIYPIRLLNVLGIRELLITNAAGAISRNLSPGALMDISDQIDLTFLPTCRFEGSSPGIIYDQDLRARLALSAKSAGIQLQSGVYCGVRGPVYETRAEIGMLKKIGADAVGMSTVHESRLASSLRMRVAGISIISNAVAGEGESVGHEDVLRQSAESARILSKLITTFLMEQ